jgi:hypothetical protein
MPVSITPNEVTAYKVNIVNLRGNPVGSIYAENNKIFISNLSNQISNQSYGITGPEGPQGVAGSQGPEGPQGVAGSQGPTGATGLSNNSNYGDSWIVSNFLSQPPAPQIDISQALTSESINVVKTSSSIGFWIKNPAQIPFGSLLIPHMDNISIIIKGQNNDIPILNKNTEFLPPKKPIEAIILSKTFSTGYVENYSFGSFEKPTYIFNVQNIQNYEINSKINLQIWFENLNNKNTPNVLSVSLNTFLTGFPPSIIPSIQNSYISSSGINIFWDEPQYTSQNPNTGAFDNSVPIEKYNIIYESVSSSRYGGVIQDNKNIETTYRNYNITNLNPGTEYKLSISAKNTISSQYGPVREVTFKTQKPPYLQPSNNSLTLPNSHYYNSKTLSDNIITEPIYQKGQSVGDCSPIINLPIHADIYNVGSTQDFLSTANLLLNNTSYTQIFFGGFSANFIEQNLPNNKTVLKNILIEDVYSQNSSGFYLKVSSITPSLNLTNGGPSNASNNPYNLEFRYTNNNNFSVNLNKNFYIDDLEEGPTGSIQIISDTIATKKVSGIEIAGDTSDTQTITYNLEANNLGRYFYRADKFFSVNDYLGIRTKNNIISSLPNTLSAPLPKKINFENLSCNIYLTSGFELNIPIQATLYNAYGISGSFYNCISIINKLLDYNSYNKILHQNPQIIDGSFTQPCRIVSQHNSLQGSFISPGPYEIYNHQNNLITDYTEELPIINGLYTSKTDDKAPYLNKIGYESLITEDKFRYATYVWDLNMNTNSSLSTIQIQLSNFIDNGLMSFNSGSNSIETNDSFILYYRIEQYNKNNIIYSPGYVKELYDSGTVNYSTVWINANNSSNDFFQNNSVKLENNGLVPGIVSNISLNINNPKDSNFIYNLRGFSLTPSLLKEMGLRIYALVGIKMNSNISYENIECKYF